MLDLFMLALRAAARPLAQERPIPLHARHHGHTFAEASRRGRFALTAIVERTIGDTGSVALQTLCVKIVLREEGGGRRPKRGRVGF